MGSLDAAGIPVPSKLNVTFRKQDIRLLQTASDDDSQIVVTSHRPALSRTIGSGSIVRDDNLTPATVEYQEEIAWGTNFESRSTTERLARDGARDQMVPDTDNIVIEPGLVPNVPQEWAHHNSNFIVRADSVTDTIIDRVPSSGVYDV
jgi:hypothetical protein